MKNPDNRGPKNESLTVSLVDKCSKKLINELINNYFVLQSITESKRNLTCTQYTVSIQGLKMASFFGSQLLQDGEKKFFILHLPSLPLSHPLIPMLFWFPKQNIPTKRKQKIEGRLEVCGTKQESKQI